jgi:hypothetical protein
MQQPPGYPPQYGAPPPQGYGAPQQPQYGQPPYPPQQPYGQPPGPPGKKSNVGMLVGIGVGGLVLVGILAGVGIYAYGHMKKGSLPLEAKQLPTTTKEIDTTIIDATREPDARIKKVYLASELSSAFCSGRGDPASRLENIGASYSGPKGAKEFFDPAHLDQIRAQLDCGGQLAANLDDDRAAYLTFETDDGKNSDTPTKHHIKVGHFKMKTLPTAEGYTSVSFGSLSGFCQTTIPTYATSLSSFGLTPPPAGSAATPPAPVVKSCEDKSNAALVNNNTWFFSDKAALDELSKGIVNPKATLPTRVAAIQDAFDATSGLPQVMLVAEPKSSKEYLEYPCEWAASQLGIHYSGSSPSSTGTGSGSGSGSSSGGITGRTEFMEACFPGKQDSKLIEEIDAKLRAIAFETDPEYVKAGAVTGNIILVTRDADTAKDAERAVKELIGDWKSQLDLNVSKLIKAGKDQSTTIRQKKFADVADTFFQALSQMKVTSSGRTLKIAYKADFTKEDKQELQDDDKSANDKRIPVTDVLEAVRDHKPIPQASLAKLVGGSWATYLLLPPLPPKGSSPKTTLTASECTAVKSKLQSVKITDLPTGDVTTAYFNQKYATCDSKPGEVTEDQKKCLATFSTAAEYTTCMGSDGTDPRMPPESEFGDKKK